MKHLTIALLALLTLGGCTTLATVNMNYQYPEMVIIENELILDKSFSETWDSLVSELSKTFYVINNIDKESRLLNVSFSVTKYISNYVDCGITDRSFQLASRNEDIEYKTADYSEYFDNSSVQISEPNTTYLHVFRQPSLDGRANIYIAPENDMQTKVAVNTRYSWQFRGEFDTLLYAPLYDNHVRVERAGRVKMDTINDPIVFNTNQTGSSGGMNPISCVSTGKFEMDILNLLN